MVRETSGLMVSQVRTDRGQLDSQTADIYILMLLLLSLRVDFELSGLNPLYHDIMF